ncbi:MAG: flippase-like domain-containing protein [Candidatus Hydrogenedentes bacterium]|nr:flippase-like domain-containing protein [Candidatus Hydrogenedentota bacterium]
MKRIIQILAGIAVAALLTWLLFRGVEWRELYASLTKMHWGWFLAAQIPIWASFWIRIVRWKYIVRAVHPATFRSMFSATQLAFLVNFTIGLRLGEFVRPLVLARLSKMSFSKSLAVCALDRVTDLIGLMVVMLIAVIAYRPESDIVLPSGIFGIENPPTIPKTLVVAGGEGTTVMLFAILVTLVVLYWKQDLVLRLTGSVLGLVSKRLADWACHLFQQFADGLHVFRSVGDMVKSLSFTALTWTAFLLSYTFLMEAFEMDWPWYAPFVVQTVLAFFVSAPGVPGMLGQFHIPIVGGLLMTVPNVTLPDAVALAIVAHVSNMIPILILGLYSLYREGFGFGELSGSAVEEAEELAETSTSDRPALVDSD